MLYDLDIILDKEALEFKIKKQVYKVVDFSVETLLENAKLFEESKDLLVLRKVVAKILNVSESELNDIGVKALHFILEKSMLWITGSINKEAEMGVSTLPSHP